MGIDTYADLVNQTERSEEDRLKDKAAQLSSPAMRLAVYHNHYLKPPRRIEYSSMKQLDDAYLLNDCETLWGFVGCRHALIAAIALSMVQEAEGRGKDGHAAPWWDF